MSKESAQTWRPTCSMEMLRLRAALLQTIRAFFTSRDYLEVETPLLSTDTVVDAHIDPFVVTTPADRKLSLQTSPEAAMKRLLAAGSPSIFQVTKSFRRGEIGSRHNPEFTLIEWYGVGTTWQDQIRMTQDLLHACARSAAVDDEDWWLQNFRQTTYQSAFRETTGLDVLTASDNEIRQRLNVSEAGTDGKAISRDDCLNQILAEKVEPTLGRSSPEILCEYPASQAALAQLSQQDQRVAHRFELYARGMELCNGYQELTDPAELRHREQQQNLLRQHRDADTQPGASHLIAAMDHGLPECSGVALGFDRLLMALTGQNLISAAIPFPMDRA